MYWKDKCGAKNDTSVENILKSLKCKIEQYITPVAESEDVNVDTVMDEDNESCGKLRSVS